MAYPETQNVLDFHFAQFGADGVYADPATEAEEAVRVIVDSSGADRVGAPPGQPGATLTRFEGHTAEVLWALRFRARPARELRRGGQVRITGPAGHPYDGACFRLEAPQPGEDDVCPEWLVIRLA